MQHHVPAEFGDAGDDVVENVQVRRSAEMADEVEPSRQDPARVQVGQLLVRDIVIDHADAL